METLVDALEIELTRLITVCKFTAEDSGDDFAKATKIRVDNLLNQIERWVIK